MAQHDMYLDNAKGAAFRADLNNALAALVSNNAGPAAPNPAFANMLWYDTSADQLKIRNEANDAWILLYDINQSGGGTTLILDADQDTTISSPSDDLITLKVGGEDQVEITDNILTLTPGSAAYYTEQVSTDQNAVWGSLGLKNFYGLDSNNNSTRYVRTRARIGGSITDGQEQGAYLISVASGGKEANSSGTGLEVYGTNSTVDHPEIRISNRHSAGQAGVLGKISFYGNDNASVAETYAQILVDLDDPTAGSEDSTVKFAGINAGTATTFLKYIGPSNVMRTAIPNYETKVSHDDDIPNKKYVDDRAPMPDCYFARSHGSITVNNTALTVLNYSINNGNVGGFGWSGGVLTIPTDGLYEIYASVYVGVWGGSIGDYLNLETEINSGGGGYVAATELSLGEANGSFEFNTASRTFIKSLSANDTIRCRYKSTYGNGGVINNAQLMVKRIG